MIKVQKVERKKDWSLNPEAFRNFLEWLDDGTDSGGQRYLEMRGRLVAYFDRKNCLAPDELADETLNRVARRLEEEGRIESEAPAKFCYITAKFVFLESLRAAKKEGLPLEDVLATTAGGAFSEKDREAKEFREKQLDCLEECTGKLDADARAMIVRYYHGKERIKIENRRALAAEFGITMNALTIRACRLRDKLEACVGKCAAG
jgi:DNA-directed RNA polymerase specialized sigma24 family protein